MFKPCLLLICCGLAFALTGCRKGDPKLVQVDGNVMVGTKPLTRGTVIFYPDAAKGNTSRDEPRGAIEPDGRYHLLTGLKEGVTPGWYKVAVTAAEQIDPKNFYVTKWLIPQKYIDPKTSKLQLEVVANPASGAYNLTLEPIK
jgi:hypothetical protein